MPRSTSSVVRLLLWLRAAPWTFAVIRSRASSGELKRTTGAPRYKCYFSSAGRVLVPTMQPFGLRTERAKHCDFGVVKFTASWQGLIALYDCKPNGSSFIVRSLCHQILSRPMSDGWKIQCLLLGLDAWLRRVRSTRRSVRCRVGYRHLTPIATLSRNWRRQNFTGTLLASFDIWILNYPKSGHHSRKAMSMS